MARPMQIFEQTHRTCHRKKRQSKAGPQPYRGSRSTTLIDSPIAKKPDPFTQNAWHALTASCYYAHPTVAVRRVRDKNICNMTPRFREFIRVSSPFFTSHGSI